MSSNFDSKVLSRKQAKAASAQQYDWLYAWERPLAGLWERMVGNVIDKKGQMVLIRILGGVVMFAMLEHFVLMIMGKPSSDDFSKTLATMAIGALVTLLVPRANADEKPLITKPDSERNRTP